MTRSTLALLAVLVAVSALMRASGPSAQKAFSLDYASLVSSSRSGGSGDVDFDMGLPPSGLAAVFEEAPQLAHVAEASSLFDPAYAGTSPFARAPGLPFQAIGGSLALAADPRGLLPEPDVLAFLGLGILGLFGLRRRR